MSAAKRSAPNPFKYCSCSEVFELFLAVCHTGSTKYQHTFCPNIYPQQVPGSVTATDKHILGMRMLG